MAPVALKITMKCTVRTAESVCLKKKSGSRVQRTR